MHTAATTRRFRISSTPVSAQPRRRAIWRMGVLCLLIALVPLRSWAWADMAAQTIAAMVSANVQASDRAMPPCHGAAMVNVIAPETASPLSDASSDASPDASPDGAVEATPTGETHPGCALCDLCHAGMLPQPTLVWAGDLPQRGAPGWVPARDTGRQGTDGLFRPPRG